MYSLWLSELGVKVAVGIYVLSLHLCDIVRKMRKAGDICSRLLIVSVGFAKLCRSHIPVAPLSCQPASYSAQGIGVSMMSPPLRVRIVQTRAFGASMA